MFWFILLSSCIAIHAQQGLLLDLHPAAGPVFEELTLGGVKNNELNNEFDEVAVDSLMDPEGKPIHEPLRAHAMVLEEELRKEAAEIQKIMSGNSDMSENMEVSLATWLLTFCGCLSVVFCGIIPAYMLSADTQRSLSTNGGNLNLLLSLGVGTMLVDVFLHLLPEAYENNEDPIEIGMRIIVGYLSFSIIEKIGASTEEGKHRLCAYLNLGVNIVDNFAHGLAVGGSFLVSHKCGLMTTLSIFLHEVPHEINDFAILLRADFSVAAATKVQFITASAGVLGSCVALYLHTSNVPVMDTLLPFTAGGFLRIATQLISELNEETNRRENIKQLATIMFGATVMGILTYYF
ncbi:unnamed protein product [Caenorhabditis brenneri]